jgi:hypothetical protein
VEIAKLLTVREVAALLKISPDSVTRRFQNLPGAIDLGSPETRVSSGPTKYYASLDPCFERFLHSSRVR